MKVSCDIIRDLLPLYAENLTSQASNELVDEHLCECDDCAKQLGILKKAMTLPMEVDTGALKQVKGAIHKRWVLTVLTVLLIAATLVCGTALMLDARIYLPAEQAVESVERLEDGSIFVRWTNYVVGCGSSYGEGSKNCGVFAWSTLRKLLFYPKEQPSYEELNPELAVRFTEEEYTRMGGMTVYLKGGADTYNIWYCNAANGRAETQLWAGANEAPEDPLMDINYHLAYYCGALALVAAAMSGAAYAFRKKRAGKYLGYGAVLAGCVSLATVICCAGQFMEHYGEFTESVLDGWFLAAPMFASCLCIRRLYALNKRDKGE